uniref:Uncharacterized protein n=1 Tax=Anguilla anguilla TaxID=7936 RepID=A0A0E9UQH8_ANGAN
MFALKKTYLALRFNNINKHLF